MKNPGIFISTPNLPRQQLAALKRELANIALEHGFTLKSQRVGSIFQMLASIASGETAVVLLADEDRNIAIRELRKIAKDTHPYIRDAFNSIADQLDAARKRDDSA